MSKYSTGLCNMLMGGVAGEGSFKQIVDGNFKLMIYSGTPPAAADDALGSLGTNNLLVTVDNAGSEVTLDSAAAAGTIAKNPGETWSGTITGAGTQTATFWRFQTTADDGLLDTTEPRVQGLISTGGTEAVVGSTSLTNGATFTVNYFTESLLPT